MFENVDGLTNNGRTDARVIGILIAHLGALGSGELIMHRQLSLALTVLIPNVIFLENSMKPDII